MHEYVVDGRAQKKNIILPNDNLTSKLMCNAIVGHNVILL